MESLGCGLVEHIIAFIKMVLNPFLNAPQESNSQYLSTHRSYLFALLHLSTSHFVSHTFFSHHICNLWTGCGSVCGCLQHTKSISQTEAELIFNGGRILSRPQHDLAPHRLWMSEDKATLSELELFNISRLQYGLLIDCIKAFSSK